MCNHLVNLSLDTEGTELSVEAPVCLWKALLRERKGSGLGWALRCVIYGYLLGLLPEVICL